MSANYTRAGGGGEDFVHIEVVVFRGQVIEKLACEADTDALGLGEFLEGTVIVSASLSQS
jgi:hypothetical protein